MVIALEQDEYGGLYLPLTPELLDELGWCVGDTLVWTETEPGVWQIAKKQ